MNFGFQGLTIFNVLFSFDGRVVAKLPFVPISWSQGLSRRSCLALTTQIVPLYFFISYVQYLLGRYVIIIGFRYQLLNRVLDITTNIYFPFVLQNIQKVLGFAPSRAANKAPGLLNPAPATK